MSWSASVGKHSRENFAAAVDAAVSSPSELDEYMAKQFESAKAAVRAIALTIPGPMISASMSGHANGVGDNTKPGYANDFINVNVVQQTD